MKTPLILKFLAALLAFGGCATRHATHPLSPLDLARLRAEVDGRRTVVTAQAGTGRLRTFWGKTYVQPDRLWVRESSNQRELPLGEVREIDANHAAAGAAIGGLAGVAVGVLAGVAISLADDEGSKNTIFGPEVKAVALGAQIGLLGLAVGIPIGAFVGAGPVWRFTPAR